MTAASAIISFDQDFCNGGDVSRHFILACGSESHSSNAAASLIMSHHRRAMPSRPRMRMRPSDGVNGEGVISHERIKPGPTNRISASIGNTSQTTKTMQTSARSPRKKTAGNIS